MRIEHPLKHFGRPALYGLAGWAFACPLSGHAANASVTIQNTAFNPPAVTINVNEQVTWSWSGGLPHNTKSTTGVWDSGIKTAPTPAFSFTFTSAGNYPYSCTVHGFTGSVTVQAAANVPPSATITAPTNGATFAAPWTGTIRATASDSDGTVSKVDFFADTTHLGTVNNPPANPTFTVTNLAAGNHTLKAVATDNSGATNNPVGVGISVVTPVAIVLSSPRRLSASAVRFSYTANPGLSYVVLRSGALPTSSPISTNKATSSTVSVLDNSATGPVNFYRVRLVPNP